MYIDVSLDRADEDTGLSTSENYYIKLENYLPDVPYPSPHDYDVMHGTINSKQH